MKFIRNVLIYIFIADLSLCAFAGSARGGVKQINKSDNSKIAIVAVDGEYLDAPTLCHPGNDVEKAFAIDTSDASGAEKLAAIKAAKAAGKHVHIFSNGKCVAGKESADLVIIF